MKFVFLEACMPHERKTFATAMLLDDNDQPIASCLVDAWATAVPFICRVFVREDRRRRGFARELITHVVERCRARQTVAVSLHVWRDNLAACALYASLGFIVTLIDPTDGEFTMTLPFPRQIDWKVEMSRETPSVETAAAAGGAK